jgi:hypothetical protein
VAEQPTSPDLALQALRDAAGPREAVDAVEALRSALWERVLAALEDPSARDVADLADRLGALSSALLRSALAAAPSALPAAARSESPRRPRVESPPTDEFGAGAQPRVRAGAGALLIDDSGDGPGRPAGTAAADEPTRAPASSGLDPRDIRVRDERGRSGDGRPWMRAISAELRRFEHDHHPFAVVLFELRDLVRLRLALAPEELRRLSALVGAGVGELFAADPELPVSVRARANGAIHQEPGRHWLVVPATDAAGARALAARIAEALSARLSSGAAAGGVLTGVAAAPAHGRSAAALTTFAEVDLYAARGPFATRVY